MAKKKRVTERAKRLYWIFWGSTTLLTGILAGFLTSHSIMLGRFFSWFVETGNFQLLQATYTVFREAHAPQTLYNAFLWLGLASGAMWTALAVWLKKERAIAVTAGLSTLWVAIIFNATGFGKMEEAVMSGTASEAVMQSFLSLNIPLHTAFAAIYTLSFLLLLIVALRNPSPLTKNK